MICFLNKKYSFRFLFCLFVCGFSFHLVAQDQKAINKLREELKQNINDSVKVGQMIETAWASFRALPDQSIEIAKQALLLAKRLDRYKKESMANNLIGAIYSFIGKYDSSNYYYIQSLHIGIIKKDIKIISKGYNNLGLNYFYQAAYNKSLENYFKSAQLNENAHDSLGMANAYVSIGNTYNMINSFKLSLDYLNKALFIFKKINNKQGIANTYNSLGATCAEVDTLKMNALSYYQLSLNYKEELNDQFGIANTLIQIGLIYSKNKNHLKSLEFTERALKIKRDLGDLLGIATTLSDRGSEFCSLGKYDNAIRCYSEALNLSNENRINNVKRDVLSGLSNAYYKMKDFQKAYEYKVLFSIASDSILNERMTGQIAEMQTKFETEKKEVENLALRRKTEVQNLQLENESQKRRSQLFVSLSLFILTMLSFLLIYNRRKHKQKIIHTAELAEAEKIRFRDVFEAEEKERVRIAQDLHDGLGQLLSTARLNVAGFEDLFSENDKPDLDRSLKIIDEACNEVRSISHNLMPSALIRLGLIPAVKEVVDNINSAKTIKIEFNTNIETTLGNSIDITVYRIIQEILNNMIKHSKTNTIDLQIIKTETNLDITIKDNGIGFNVNELKDAKGIGWKNIFSRVSMLNGNIKIESKPQIGTAVFINLNVKNGK